VLIDARSLNARLTLRIIASLTRLIAAVAPKKIGEKLKLNVMRAIWNRLGQASYYGPYLRAMSNYLPPKLRSNVVIVLSEEHRVMKKLLLSYSPTPWNRLAPKVHCRYVAGTHHGAITTHAGELALLLDGLLSTEPHNSINWNRRSMEH
jgi:hypothetical protein